MGRQEFLLSFDSGEAAVGEAGAMMYMQSDIQMDTVFGDGSQQGGLFGKLMGAGKRLLTGEGLFFATLRGPGRVWLQSLPLSRLANRIIASAPAAGGKSAEQGSLLGAGLIGGLIGGHDD